MTLFEVQDLTKRFGGIVALDGPTFDIEAGELVGLIGPNGAGKTTLFNCVTGVERADSGTVRFRGTDVTHRQTHEHARHGLVRTFQLTRELTTLTVEENVKLAMPDHPGEETLPAITRSGEARQVERAASEKAAELLSFFELDHLAGQYASVLSGGQRKLLEVARALMLDPDLLLLDEPLAGVNPTLQGKITGSIQEINDDGVTFLIIEHEIETLAALVDRLVVMNKGRVLADGAPETVLSDEIVIDAYLGDA